MINNENNLSETDAAVWSAWAAVLLVEHIDDPANFKLSSEERANYGIDADIMLAIAKCDIKRSTADRCDRNCAKRSRVEVKLQEEKTLCAMIKSVALPSRKDLERLVRFLQAIVTAFFSHSSAVDLMLQYFERCWEVDPVMIGVKKRNVFKSFFNGRCLGLSYKHVHATIEQCRLTEFLAKRCKDWKKVVQLLQISSF